MTFDDGHGSELRTSDDDFSAKIQGALGTEGMTLEEACSAAKLSVGIATQMMEAGTYGFQKYYQEWFKLLSVLGRDGSWLLTGDDSCIQDFRKRLEDRANRYVWEFIFKADRPRSEAQPLITLYLQKITSAKCTTIQGAHRNGLPGSWKDVAWRHEQLKNHKK